jgi:hypothetical protein|uniref:DUF1543 domain-containing protein n=1 Tax=Gelidibacter sp. TaxID=2018083 RepID=UPI00404A3E68
MKLFYVIIGATPQGRHIEQHDVFFGIAHSLKDLVPAMKSFWRDAQIHIDAYQEVQYVDGYKLDILPKGNIDKTQHLFFINLGGYKEHHFEEFHEQHLMVDTSMGKVIKRVKQTHFYKTMGFTSAESHIDDKHGVDIDDIFKVSDMLPKHMKDHYSIQLTKTDAIDQSNITKIGYIKIDKL